MGVHGRVSFVITLGILPRKALKSKGKQRPGAFPIWEFGRHGRLEVRGEGEQRTGNDQKRPTHSKIE